MKRAALILHCNVAQVFDVCVHLLMHLFSDGRCRVVVFAGRFGLWVWVFGFFGGHAKCAHAEEEHARNA